MLGLLKTLSELMRGKPLVCRQVLLRPPTRSDWREWAELREASRAWLKPWEPAWEGDELSRRTFMRRLRAHALNSQTDRGYAFLIFERRGGALVGGASVGHVRRGAARSATLGYWIGQPHAGRGYMTDALSCLMPFAFDRLALHRLTAAVAMGNAASRRVLEKVGFAAEGVARKYMQIDGEWRDHEIYGMLSTDERPTAVEAVGRAPRRLRARRGFARQPITP